MVATSARFNDGHSNSVVAAFINGRGHGRALLVLDLIGMQPAVVFLSLLHLGAALLKSKSLTMICILFHISRKVL